jgi:hypothetical protein
MNNFLEEGDIDDGAAILLVMMQFRPKIQDILFQNPLHTGTSAQRKACRKAINPRHQSRRYFAEIR